MGNRSLWSNAKQREKKWKANAGTQNKSFPRICNARHQVTGGCEPTEGTASKTNSLGTFFLILVSGPCSSMLAFQGESKTYYWDTFLQRGAMNRSVLGVPLCMLLSLLFLKAKSCWTLVRRNVTQTSHYFWYHELGKKSTKPVIIDRSWNTVSFTVRLKVGGN